MAQGTAHISMARSSQRCSELTLGGTNQFLSRHPFLISLASSQIISRSALTTGSWSTRFITVAPSCVSARAPQPERWAALRL